MNAKQHLRITEQVSNDDRLAFQQKHAAAILDISPRSLVREINRRKIYPTKTFRLITRTELLRYLDEEVQLARRSRRTMRAKRETREERAAI